MTDWIRRSDGSINLVENWTQTFHYSRKCAIAIPFLVSVEKKQPIVSRQAAAMMITTAEYLEHLSERIEL